MARPAPARLLTVSLVGILALFVLGGCEASVSVGGDVSADEVAEKAQTALDQAARNSGYPPFPKITCPDDLDGEVGAKTTCYSTFNGSKHRIFVKVTSVKGDTVNMDFHSEGHPTR
jgi:type II secretory pathway pseudopilin PulG